MKQELIPLSLPLKWKEALSKIHHSFGHTWESCYAMNLTTGLDTYLYVLQDADVSIVCPIAERTVKGHTDVVTPYGFSGFVGTNDFPEFQNYWRSFLLNRNIVCGYIGLSPLFENPSYLNIDEVYEYNAVYVLDLKLSLEQLFQNLSINRKRQLKNFTHLSELFVTDTAQLNKFFVENYHEFFNRKGASQVYNFSDETLLYLSGLENVVITGIQNNGVIVAVAVFSFTSFAADYLFNVSLPQGEQYTAALIWQGIKYLKMINIPLLNLGGGVHKGDSISQFKERFGGKKMPLKCLKQVYNFKIFKMICEEFDVDPYEREGFFPGYINKLRAS